MKFDNNYSYKSNTDNVVLSVQRNSKKFYFSKMWWYIIKIPGLLFDMPLPWYYYIGITTQDDPMIRIKQHVTENKCNPAFEYIREHVPFDLWEIEFFELPIIGSNGEQNLNRLRQKEIDMIAKYDTFHGEYGLNATPGGEDPFVGLHPIGWATGFAYTSWDNTRQAWRYNNGVHLEKLNKDLRILNYSTEGLSQEIGVQHVIDPEKANYYLALSDSYINNIKLRRNIFGFKQVSVIKKGQNNFVFRWQRREQGKKIFTSRKLSSDFLKILIAKADLEKICFNLNLFVYKAAAVNLGFFDFDQKMVQPTFITEDQFNARYNFTLDQITEAISFLQGIEAGVIPDQIKVLLPKDLNT